MAFRLHELNETVLTQGESEDEVSLLLEYRTSLIADVVTGKLDAARGFMLVNRFGSHGGVLTK